MRCFSSISDRRKDLINRCMFDANMLDMIVCDYCEGETDTRAPALSARSIEVCSYWTDLLLIICM